MFNVIKKTGAVVKLGLSLLCCLLSNPLLGAQEECVVLLHGLSRDRFDMRSIQRVLKKNNYRVWNQSYPSTSEPIEKVSVKYIKKGIRFCEDQKAHLIHFVTHSMGGIMVRYFLQDHEIPNQGRIVMLAPPNQGSEVTDFLKDLFFMKCILGLRDNS